ncbi:unnamed protein product, partial [Pleuronectes platessa]
ASRNKEEDEQEAEEDHSDTGKRDVSRQQRRMKKSVSPFSLQGPGERDNKTDERAGLVRRKGHGEGRDPGSHRLHRQPPHRTEAFLCCSDVNLRSRDARHSDAILIVVFILSSDDSTTRGDRNLDLLDANVKPSDSDSHVNASQDSSCFADRQDLTKSPTLTPFRGEYQASDSVVHVVASFLDPWIVSSLNWDPATSSLPAEVKSDLGLRPQASDTAPGDPLTFSEPRTRGDVLLGSSFMQPSGPGLESKNVFKAFDLQMKKMEPMTLFQFLLWSSCSSCRTHSASLSSQMLDSFKDGL